MSSIVLKAEHRRAIAKYGEDLYPKECRGLLLGYQNGTKRTVLDLMFISEQDQSQTNGNRYEISGEEMLEGETLARDKDLEIIGSFHSHIDEPARPSIHDREFAQPKFVYVIVGIRQGRAHELAAWKISEDRTAFFQEDIRSS
jgi:proteasome lid subunit RPN8/RPN11